MEPQLHEIIAGPRARLADRLPCILQAGAGLQHPLADVQALDADLPDVQQLLRHLRSDVDRVLGVDEVAAILRVPFRHDEVALADGPGGREVRLVEAVLQVPQLLGRVVHRAGREQVEDVGLRSLRDLRADHLAINLGLGPAGAGSGDQRVEHGAGHAARCPHQPDLLFALDDPHLLERPTEVHQLRRAQRLLQQLYLAVEECRDRLDGGVEPDKADAGPSVSQVLQLGRDLQQAAERPDVVHPILDRQQVVVRPVHVPDVVVDDRVAIHEEQGVGGDLGRGVRDVAEVREPHVPVDVVAQEQQHVDVGHEHALAQPIPTPVPLLMAELGHVLHGNAGRLRAVRHRVVPECWIEVQRLDSRPFLPSVAGGRLLGKTFAHSLPPARTPAAWHYVI